MRIIDLDFYADRGGAIFLGYAGEHLSTVLNFHMPAEFSKDNCLYLVNFEKDDGQVLGGSTPQESQTVGEPTADSLIAFRADRDSNIVKYYVPNTVVGATAHTGKFQLSVYGLDATNNNYKLLGYSTQFSYVIDNALNIGTSINFSEDFIAALDDLSSAIANIGNFSELSQEYTDLVDRISAVLSNIEDNYEVISNRSDVEVDYNSLSIDNLDDSDKNKYLNLYRIKELIAKIKAKIATNTTNINTLSTKVGSDSFDDSTKINDVIPSNIMDALKKISTALTSLDIPSTINLLKGNGSGGISVANPGSDYQPPLVSGTNIKTINNISILGSGNINIEGGSGEDSWNATAKALLITILRNGVYSSDQSTNISALQSALAGGGGTDGYVISAILQNVSIDNDDITVQPNSSYTAHLTADSGYTLDTVTVTMGGLDITSTVYSNGTVSIATVTANVTIMASATEIPAGGFVYDPTKWLSNKGISVAADGAIEDSTNQDTYSEKITFIKGDKLKVKTSASLGIWIYCWDEDDNFISKAGEIWLNESNNYTGVYTGDKNNMAKIMFATNKGIGNPSGRVVSMEVE